MCVPNISTATEALLHYPIHNQAMPGYVGASCLFYLEGRQVSFRCCPRQNLDSDNPPTLYRIAAYFSDTFEPEKIMGVAIGQESFPITKLDGSPVPITKMQIPTQLAERIQAIATAGLALTEKYKIIQPAHPKGMCVALTKEQVMKFDERDLEIAQLSVVKEAVGAEFEKFTSLNGISLSY